MSELAVILRARFASAINTIRGLRTESQLKIGFITLFVLGFWFALFQAFREAFEFVAQAPGFEALLVGIVFSMFFLSLLIMLTFSNAVLLYTSLYRSGEVEFLLSLPVGEQSVFLYKYAETIVYSSWAFLYMGVPVIVAFGHNRGVPWYFYPVAMLMYVTFVAIPAGLGSLLAMLLVRFVPRSRFKLLIGAAVLSLFILVLVVLKYVSGIPKETFGYSELARLTGRLSFSQNQFLPSFWLSKGVLSLARAEPLRALFFFLVILSNSLFLTGMAQAASGRIFWVGFSRSRSSASRRVRGRRNVLGWIVDRTLFFLPRELRLFITKDIRTFLRDTTQWGQVLIFFGVLAIYIGNIPSLGYRLKVEEARSSIALLNLAATCLVLSTFTGRFIFPLLSLEGKKFWVLGLAPVARKQILYGKFFFTFLGSLVISESLITLSDFMLDFPFSMWVGHAVLALAICSGLSAISVGLGARYPNLREDNPAKIVAGFGGTLNLIVSMIYIAVMVAMIGVPYHFAFAARTVNEAFYYRTLAGYLCLALMTGAATSVFFLNLGKSQFEKMEL